MAGRNQVGTIRVDELLKIIITAVLYFLPAIVGEFGWMRLFAPLPAFYLLVTCGEGHGNALLSKAVLLAGVITLVFARLPFLLITLTFLPSGYVLARSLKKKETPNRTGLLASATLLAGWLLGTLIYGIVADVNLVTQTLKMIDTSLLATFSMYEEQAKIAPDTLAQIKEAFNQIRILIPVIFPSIVVISALVTVWVNQLLGDWLLKKTKPGMSHWPPYGEWRLPDPLVWVVIIGGVGLMLPIAPLHKICLNVILVSGTLYFFQGLAVLSSLFNKWAVPWAFRLFIYTLILIQAYGIVFLAIAGLIDVWFDLRKSQDNTA